MLSSFNTIIIKSHGYFIDKPYLSNNKFNRTTQKKQKQYKMFAHINKEKKEDRTLTHICRKSHFPQYKIEF